MKQILTGLGSIGAALGSLWSLPIRRGIGVLALLSLLAPGLVRGVDTIPISHAPPYLLTGVPPNLILTLDNSGSMRAANSSLPQGPGVGPVPRFDVGDTAASINRQYYDPALTYRPPLRADGSSLPDAQFSAAPRDAFREDLCGRRPELCAAPPGSGCRINLATEYAPLWEEDTDACAGPDGLPAGAYTIDLNAPENVELADRVRAIEEDPALTPTQRREAALAAVRAHYASGLSVAGAFYHRPKGDECRKAFEGDPEGPDPGWTSWQGSERDAWLARCLERVAVDSSAQEQTNFANWYAYYRNRWLSLQTVVSRKVAGLDPGVRVTYQSMEDGLDQLGERFDTFGGGRESFYDWLFLLQANTREGLLDAAVRVFEAGQTDEAYLEDPKVNRSADNPIRACRNNFHLVFSDGGWDPLSNPPDWLKNNDGIAQPLPAGDDSFADRLGVTAYPTDGSTRLYRDANTGGLADIVFHSWITDLRPEDELVRTLIRDPMIPSGRDPSYVFWNPANDPADWQHITTFAVGLGVQGQVSYPSGDYGGGLNIGSDGFPGAWGTSSASAAEMVDDLWHAGINGRGGYSLATDPGALGETFETVFDSVSRALGADAAVAAPAFDEAPRFVLQATLNTAGWTGDLRAYRISGGPGLQPCPLANRPRGEPCEDPRVGYYWSLADRLDGNAARGIAPPLWTTRRLFSATISYGSGGTKTYTPIPFGSGSWDSLSEEDRRALLGLADDAPIPPVDAPQVQKALAVMDFITGKPVSDPSELRERDSLVGDIIHGAPLVVGPPSRRFNDPGYQTFAKDKKDRPSIVYVGANDGLLRGVALETGTELFAYVPRPLFGSLARLAEPGYGSVPAHTPYVDGPIAAGDVYFADQWRSVVVGALGAGAQGVYAIRSPSISSGSDLSAEDVHLWDFSDRDDPDLGYIFGKPAIVRILLSDGSLRWVAVFGNGYNSPALDGRRPAGCDDPDQDTGSSACGRALLYVVDIESGRLMAKLDTLKGRRDDPRHEGDAQEPNGLGPPTLVGRTLTGSNGSPLGGGDPIATLAYAGDLHGNLWRFNLVGLADGGSGGEAPTRVFQARTSSGPAQPITAPVALAPHPTGVGTLVLFGTGRYLGQDDVADPSVQSFYGIWDQGGAEAVSTDDLLKQEFLETDLQVARGGTGALVSAGRTSTAKGIDWSVHRGWRLDLLVDGDAEGERVVSAPQLRGDRVLFTSLVPEPDPCQAGGFSWVNALSFASGSRPDETPFDFDLSGTFDSADLLTPGSGAAVAGTSMRLVDGGIYSGLAALAPPGGGALSFISSSDGGLLQLRESPVLSWRVWQQLQ